MKKILIALIVLAVVVLGFLFLHKGRDAQLKQQVIGTWSRTGQSATPGHLTLSADGSYSSFWGDTNHKDSYRGTWQVKDGMLILACAYPTVLDSSKDKIIQVDKHQLIYEVSKGRRITLSR